MTGNEARKPLEEMTKEELWQLFPISLTSPKECWAEMYEKSSAQLHQKWRGLGLRRMSHIGSTSIHGIFAKDIVDILAEFDRDADLRAAAEAAAEIGYRIMFEEDGRVSLNKGYTVSGFAPEVYHLHLRTFGDCDELYFRDMMNERPDIAKEYEAMKISLWKRFEHDRDGYTMAKTDFIRHWTREAKKLFPGRYEEKK